MSSRWTEAIARRFLAHTKPSQRRVNLQQEGFPCVAPISLELPYPPLNNTYYRHFHGKTLLSREGRAYREVIAQLIMASWPSGILRPFNNLLVVSITVHPPSRRHRPDSDAVLKAPFDAMEYAGVYLNDALIQDHHVYKRAPRPHLGCLYITIEPYKEE